MNWHLGASALFAIFSPSNKYNVGWMKRLRVQFSFRLRWKFSLSSAFIFINSFTGIIITIVLALLSLFSFITGWQQWNTAGNITRSLRPVSHVALMRLEKLILAKGGRYHNAMCWIYKEDEIFVVPCFALPTQPSLSARLELLEQKHWIKTRVEETYGGRGRLSEAFIRKVILNCLRACKFGSSICRGIFQISSKA